jgi:hypothetical protein
VRDVAEGGFLQRHRRELQEARPEPVAVSADVLEQPVRIQGGEQPVGGRAREAGGSNDGGVRARSVLHRVQDRDRAIEHADLGGEDLAGSGHV